MQIFISHVISIENSSRGARKQVFHQAHKVVLKTFKFKDYCPTEMLPVPRPNMPSPPVTS